MVSVIDALVGRHDVIVYDAESHACIIDGVRLHIGKRFVFGHNDMDSLEKQLQHAEKITAESGGGILVITEGVFGMAGDLGKLKEVVDLKKKYAFRLLVDDAHGFGTLGTTGAGTGEHFGVQDDIDIYFSTFAKSMAGIGGFIASNEQVIEYLKYNMRSQTFAKALPMPMVIGAQKRLELLKSQPQLREKLWTVVAAMQNGLKEAGFDIGKTESPVTPVIVKGGNDEAVNIIIDLRENYGIFCSVVTYPVVPKGIIMLRIIPTAAHTLDDVAMSISAFKKVSEKLKAGAYMTNAASVTV
jgi:glycine C-acetyltransferase